MSAPPRPPPGFRPVDDDTTPEPPPGFRPVPTEPGVQPAKPSIAASALRGFMQGGTYGFADELAGGADALRSLPPVPQAVVGVLHPGAAGLASLAAPDTPQSEDTSALLRAYLSARDAARKETRAAEEANPKAFATGQFAGAVAAPGPKGMGAGRLAKQGAMYGAVSGLGGSDADLTKGELLPTLVNTAISAGTGAIIAPVASGLSNRFGRFLREKSQENALKAVGAKAGIADVLGREGIKTADEARQLGQTAIDQGLVPPFSTAADVAQNSGFALERQGARIAGVLADADAPIPIPGQPGASFPAPPFDLNRAAWRATQEVMGPDGLTSEAMSKVKPAANIVERILKQGEVDPSFSAANRLKSDFYNGINYGTNATDLGVNLQKSAIRGLKKSMEEQVAERLGPEAADELMAANRNYGALKTIQGLAGTEARRAMGREGAFSPGAIGASLLAQNPTPMAMKALAPYLPSTVSAIQRTASPLAMPTAQALTKPGVQALSEKEQDSISAFLQGI